MSDILSRLDKVIVFALVLFAAIFCYICGLRGVFAVDQSIVFDGAYRIVQGQVPWKDFIVPFGPMSLWYQALFFWLTGVNYSSYALGAAVANAIATFAAIRTVKLLLPRQRLFAYAAGLLTATWFYAPSGTTYIEHTGLFFGILIVWLGASIVAACQEPRGVQWFKAVLAGIFFSLAVLSKQNMGLLVLPLFPLLLLTTISTRGFRYYFLHLVGFALGAALTIGLFALWLVSASDVDMFVLFWFQIASNAGKDRFRGWRTFMEVTWYWKSVVIFLAMLAVVGWAALARILASIFSRRQRSFTDNTITAALLSGALIIFTVLFMKIANKSEPNNLGLAGLALALGLGMIAEWSNSRSLASWLRQKGVWLGVKRAALVGAVLMIAVATADGIYVSLTRQAHEGTRFASEFIPLTYVNYRGLRWGNPTRVDNAWEDRSPEEGVYVLNTEIDELTSFLVEDGRNFFIYPAHTFLYGTIGVPSPQPIVWFYEGLTYPDVYDPRIDQWVVDDLIRNDVQIVVIEKVYIMNRHTKIEDFPKLQAFIAESFTPVKEIGIFQIYAKNTAANN